MGENDRVEAPEFAKDTRHRFGEVFEERPKSVQVAMAGILCCEGREIGIAVKAILSDGHAEERSLPIEHRRPRIYPIRGVDDESPAHLAEMSRTWPAENEPSDGRMDAVGSHDEVVRARRPISEDDVHFARLLTEHRHSGAKTDGDACAFEKDALEFMASDAQAGANRIPELCQLDFRQVASRVVQHSLMCHTDSPIQHFVRKTKHLERASAIARDVQAGAARWP